MKRENVLQIRLSDDELASVKAKSGSLPVSQWVRQQLLLKAEDRMKVTPIAEILPEAKPEEQPESPMLENTEEMYRQKCISEFGSVLKRAEQYPGWAKMTWQSRYEGIKEAKEAQS